MAATAGARENSSGLVERAEVLAAVDGLLGAALAGRGGALFIVGSAGLGKTSVLEHAIALARPRFAVRLGGGDRVEAVLPFGLIGQALDPLLDVDPRAPATDAATEISAQARLYAILRQVRQAAAHPLLLTFDDLHWSDPDSLTAIHLLCRRLSALPVALLATTRPYPTEAVTSAQELVGQGLAQVEYLAPLSRSAARGLVRARAGTGISDAVVQEAVTRCAGNPLLLEHAADEVRQGRPLSGQRLLMSRFLAVGETGQRYIRAASVLGTRFHTAVAAKMTGLPTSETTAELEGLFQAGLLLDAGEGWAAFTHALVRHAIYDELASPVRRALHTAAYTALLAQRCNPAEAAEHALAAHLVGDPQAIATLARAGRAALAAGAVGAAHRYLAAAARLAGEDAPIELLLDLGRALIASGAIEAAIVVYERLLRRPSLPEAARIAALGQLGQAAFNSGQLERAAAWFETAVGLAEQGHPDLAVRALIDQSFQTWARLGPHAALPLAQRARELAGEDPTPLRACADAAWGLCAYLTGDPHGLDATQAAARSIGSPLTSLGDIHWAFDHTCVPADVANWAERFADAQRLYTDILSAAELRCEPFILCHASFCLADCLLRLGRLTEALERCEHALEVAELLPVMIPLPTAHKALILLEMGRLDEAAIWCERLAAMAQGHSWHLVVMFDHHRRGTLALRRGEVQTACTLFAPLLDLVNEWGVLDPCQVPWAWDAISAFLICGRDADARRIVKWMQPRAAVLPSRWPKVVAASGRAALAERDGDPALAEACFAQALVLHDEMDIAMPLAQAQTLTEYGAFLNRTGEPARARPLLAEALRITETCGAAWHASQARVEWRRAGGRTRTRDPNHLSPPETAVATLARTGHTNRQIAHRLHLSVKTVETHLRHVYQKLGIRSRWQLTDHTGPDPAKTLES